MCMDEPVFAELEKRLRRKLKHTARFYPVDLHCHSPLSPCFGRKDGESQEDTAATADDIARAACKSGLFMVAVTDHHRCENAQAVAQAAQRIRDSGENLYPNNNVIVLPGMEVSVEENGRTVHILAVFAEGTSTVEIERVLHNTGIEPNPEHRTADEKVTRKRLIEMIKTITACGGLAILAHVNSSNGYREEMKGIGWSDQQVLTEIHRLEPHAVEISGPEDTEHFSSPDEQICCVIGSDAHYVSDIGRKPHITRAKMTTPCFSELARAFKDPATRIRFEEISPAYIKSIVGVSLDGGFLHEQTLPFTSNLNCLIGGRGTGKSTLIEAIRYVFQHAVPHRHQHDIDEMLDEVLNDCTVTLIFEDELGEKHVLQRTYGDTRTKIMTLDGLEIDDIELPLSENLRVSIYGWSEIEGIAKDPAEQLDLIDSFIPAMPQLKAVEQTALASLKASAREIQTQLDSIERDAEQVGNLVELESELEKLGEEETPAEKQYAQVENETDLVTSIETTLGGLHERVETLDIEGELQAVAQTITESKNQEKLLSTAVFEEISALLTEASQEESCLRLTQVELLSELDELASEVGEKTAQLGPVHEQVKQQFEALLQELEQAEARQLARRREQLRKEIRRRTEAQERKQEAVRLLKGLIESRKGIIDQVKQARTDLFDTRSQHVAALAARLPKGRANVDIGIDIHQQGNRQEFVKLLTDKLVGLKRHWREGDYPSRIAGQFTPTAFAQLLRSTDSTSLQEAGFEADEADDILRHFDGCHGDIMDFEACVCVDLPVISFDVEGQKRPIQQLSPGQRCTALFPIILLETDTPLIIDQPEDNLDNQFIFDLVVETMRRLKEHRQIIVATHNPNIPVSGDAENILVFETDGLSGKIVCNGSIDYEPIIKRVKGIMEGGDAAFEVRMQKYGY